MNKKKVLLSSLTLLMLGAMTVAIFNQDSRPIVTKALEFNETPTYVRQIKIQPTDINASDQYINIRVHIWANTSDWTIAAVVHQEIKDTDDINIKTHFFFDQQTMGQFGVYTQSYQYSSIGGNTMSYIVGNVFKTTEQLKALTLTVKEGCQFKSYEYAKNGGTPKCFTNDSEQSFQYVSTDEVGCLVFSQVVSYQNPVENEVNEIMIHSASDWKRIHFALPHSDYALATGWTAIDLTTETFNLNENITFNGVNNKIGQEGYWLTNGDNTFGFANTSAILPDTPSEDEYSGMEILIPVGTEMPMFTSNSSHASLRQKYVTIKERKYIFNRAEFASKYYYYTCAEYTVKFNNDNGDNLQKTTVKHGDTPEYTGPIPTKEASAQYTYTFDGWNEVLGPITGAKTYVAKYKETLREYTVTFIDDSQMVKYGEQPVMPLGNPTKDADEAYSYTFAGWALQSNPETIVSDFTCYGDAHYIPVFTKTAIEYTCTWNGNIVSYTVENRDQVLANMKADLHQDTAEFAYSHNLPEQLPLQNGGVYEETRTKKTYTVTFGEESQMVEYGEKPVMPTNPPIKPADVAYRYTFAGWALEATPETIVTDFTCYGEAHYVPVFTKEAIVYSCIWNGETITYTIETREQVLADMKASLQKDTAEYHYTNNLPDELPLENGHVYEETRTKQVYTVFFNVDGGTPVSAQNIEYGAHVVRPEDPTKEGYKFLGWYVGDEKFDFENDIVTGPLTLTAKWELTTAEEPETIEEPKKDVPIGLIAGGGSVLVIGGVIGVILFLKRKK